MEIRDAVTGVTAAAVVGTGAIVGGGTAIDNYQGGPEKRRNAELTELQQIVREEVRSALKEAWPTSTGKVTGMTVPNSDYKKQIPQK